MLLDILIMMKKMIPRRIGHLHWLRLLWLEIGERRGCGGGGDLEVFCFRDPSDVIILSPVSPQKWRALTWWSVVGTSQSRLAGWSLSCSHQRTPWTWGKKGCQGDLSPWPLPYCLVYFLVISYRIAWELWTLLDWLLARGNVLSVAPEPEQLEMCQCCSW